MFNVEDILLRLILKKFQGSVYKTMLIFKRKRLGWMFTIFLNCKKYYSTCNIKIDQYY